MSVNLKTYDILIQDDFFTIVEKQLEETTENHSLDLLLKIENVLKKNLNYFFSLNDPFSIIYPRDLIVKLEEISIHAKKQAEENSSFFSLFWGGMSKADEAYIKVMNLLYPPAALSETRIENGREIEIILPIEVALRIASYLNFNDLKSFAKVNRSAKNITRHEILKKSLKLGFKGDSSTKSAVYINKLETELSDLKFEYYVQNVMEKIAPTGLIYNFKTFFTIERNVSRLDDIYQKISTLSKNQFVSLCHLTYRFNLGKVRKLFNEDFVPLDDDLQINFYAVKEIFDWAINLEEENILRILLSFNSPNYPDSNLLHLAIMKGNIRIIKILLDAGSLQNHKDKFDKIPLHIAVKHSTLSVLKLLLKKGGNEFINARSSSGTTPLHYAVLIADYDKVELLLKYGAYTEVKDQLLLTPLAIACGCFFSSSMHMKKPIIELLLKYKANNNFIVKGKSLKNFVLSLFNERKDLYLYEIAQLL